jgi:hypothetical protein
MILPDGTTLLVDAGALGRSGDRVVPPKPDNTRSPGEWIARYIKQVHPKRENASLDYALLTHFHGDHMGVVTENSAESQFGDYRLSGITEVGEYIPISQMLDRGWPDYDYPAALDNGTVRNYRAFLQWQSANRGMRIERFQPGRRDQIVLVQAPDEFPSFEVRNVAANGEIWTGVGENTFHLFPPLGEVPAQDLPSENPCSIAFRLSYGQFDYYTGGDLIGIPSPGAPGWHDVETPVAKAVGPVEVCVLNHHGYIDSQNPFFVSTLRPRVWILPVWDSAHPTPSVYPRLRSSRLYPGPRDIFTTNMHEANKLVTPGLDQLTSDQGHVVVRVDPGGRRFHVFVLDDTDETLRVKSVHGPYEAR